MHLSHFRTHVEFYLYVHDFFPNFVFCYNFYCVWLIFFCVRHEKLEIVMLIFHSLSGLNQRRFVKFEILLENIIKSPVKKDLQVG